MPTLRVADATQYHEIRGSGPLVVLVGAPMDAAAFAPAADLLAVDHTVLTTDPRGIHRSPLDDPEQDSTPEDRADDLAALLTHLGSCTPWWHTSRRWRNCSTTATSCARTPPGWSSGTARATRSGRGSCSSTRPASRYPPS